MFYAINQEALLIASPIATIIAALIGTIGGGFINSWINKKNWRNQYTNTLINKIDSKDPKEILEIMTNNEEEWIAILKMIENLNKKKKTNIIRKFFKKINKTNKNNKIVRQSIDNNNKIDNDIMKGK